MDNITNDIESKLVQNHDDSKKPSIWKISHGYPRADLINSKDNETLVNNGYVGIGYPDNLDKQQRKDFLKIQPSDYFYLVRDGHIILLGQLTNDKPILGQLTNDGRVTINDNNNIIVLTNLAMKGWAFRKFTRIDEPKITPYKIDFISLLGGMPSNQSTVQEVKTPEALKSFELKILKPVFNLELKKLGITVPQQKSSQRDSQMSSLNQILYGPPGTGKTYNTVNKAIEIANPYFFIDKDTEQKKPRERKEIKKEFDRLMNEGQIVFTTFHQSMCYEDFIEGIKPETTLDDKVIYYVKPGIFKSLCQAATTPDLIGFNAAYGQLIKELSEIEAADSDATEVKTIEIKTPTGKPFSISLNSNDNLSLHTGQNRSVQGTLTKENIQKVINNEYVFKGYDGYFKGVVQYLTDHYSYSNEIENTKKNFVLIIDEINRGNVSQIFGELITLIEEDKRLDCNEELKVTLPYSKDVPFGVPKNLYIIGTMNTADRSVEALDAALRRRFSFEEMPPNSKLIATEGELKETQGVLGEINLPSLLDIINYRIEKLLDKDHQIGHSYFISVKNLNGLKLAFQNKIIPLLQEYFFGDYGKIGLVLGKGFVSKDDSNKNNFADFSDADADEFSERPIFKINSPTSDDAFIEAINSLLNKKTDVE